MLRYFVLPFLFVATAFAADPSQQAGYYQGNLGDHLAVTMMLTGKGDKDNGLAGKYRYAKYGSPIWLMADRSTEKAAGDQIRLTESDPRSTEGGSGHFRGTLDDNRGFSGTWTNREGTKSLAFDLKRIADIAEYTNHSPRFTVERAVPQFNDNSAFHNAVNDLLTATAKKEIDAAAEDLKESTRDSDTATYPWENTASIEILYADDSLVSLIQQNYEYTGGAHGNTTYEPLIFTWHNHKLVALRTKDLVSDSSRAQIDRLLVKSLTRQKAGWAENAKTIAPGDWTMNPTADGLIFTFAPYEVDSYAGGTYTVMLPYKTVPGVIPVGGLLNRYVDAGATRGPAAASVRD